MEELKDMIATYDNLDDFKSNYLFDMQTVHDQFTYLDYLLDLADIYIEKIDQNELEHGESDSRTMELDRILEFINNEILRLIYAGQYYHSLPPGEDLPIIPKRAIKKPRTADVNYKFALLEEMGVIKWLKNNILTNNEDRAEILQEIMGGSTDTLIDYLKGKPIHKEVKQKELDLLNDKRYPK